MLKPDYIFEVSWEVCNKIGGIYTVLSSKAPSIQEDFDDKYIFIGPDIWKGFTEHPDFIQDDSLFADWIQKAKSNGLNIRAGRWNIDSKPIALLVDFTPFFSQKDLVLKELWEDYKLDSLSGGWDYIEPVLFGYAAAKVIKSFYKYYLGPYHKVVANFHEWMTGSGVLYLEKNVPAVGTVFTTHATVLGRSISGNGNELYENLKEFEAKIKAGELKVVSKNSLETKAAVHADAFTTVSEITALECEHFFERKPDVITINGFDHKLIPNEADYQKQKANSRKKILDVASRLSGREFKEDTFLVLNSGRYEFHNKGIDLFIDSIGELKNRESKRDLLAIIAVPAGTMGPLPQLVSPGANPIQGRERYISHLFNNMEHDPVLNWIMKNDIKNDSHSDTHILFVPSYLDGNDGVFNLDYYQFLMAFDYTVFPSYYEPWGYTPLESVAFKIPTITTQFAGFGKWVRENFSDNQPAVTILDYSSKNPSKLSKDIAETINRFMIEGKAEQVSKSALLITTELEWSLLKENYYKAWNIALKNSTERKIKIIKPSKSGAFEAPPVIHHHEPTWKKILVRNEFPLELMPLKEMMNNIWWSWNEKATSLMDSIGVGKGSKHNPIRRLENLSSNEINGMLENQDFMNKMNEVYGEYQAYMAREKDKKDQKVAYFSMEYGLHTSIKTYSGGLGVLAGDYLKQASDSNKDMVAVGLLYRYGYFKQEINTSGDQIAVYKAQKFTQMPLSPVVDEDGKWIYINLAFPGRLITAKIWKLMVGSVPLYLLDTDIEQNKEEDRKLTYHLYGGDKEHRLKQEILLGFGGIRLLDKLNVKADIFHSNEGHSAFIGIERIRRLMEEKHLDFNSALEVVRASTLFTTHTPVPAGHDTFKEDLIRAYLGHYPANYLGIDWGRFIGLGKVNPMNYEEDFSMSILATNLSRMVNGVSKIHGRVSREMFRPLYPGYFEKEIQVGHVTNGIHYPTWTDDIWKNTYAQLFGKDFFDQQFDQSHWEKIHKLDDSTIWKNRKDVKKKLIDEVLYRLENQASYYQTNPKMLLRTKKFLTEDTLVIGFARRFATYKRATLLFNNLDRLANIVNQEGRPVVFVFAGKAHPRDVAGQNLIKHIIEVSRQDRFEGKIIFLENYDMSLGKLLTSGVDVWLNTPTRPLEASGTSGEKAIMNGVLNFSVLDGWWAEGYKKDAGWALEEKKRFDAQEAQDQLDGARIYHKFENEIVPAFYNKNEEGLPTQWISYIKNNIAGICPHFTMQRMLDDYYRKFYRPLFSSSKNFKKDEFANAIKLSQWKSKIYQHWDEISVQNLRIPDPNAPLGMNERFEAEISLNISGLSIDDLGIEVVIGNKKNGNSFNISQLEQLKPHNFEDDIATYGCSFILENAGVHDYAFRLYPKNKLLGSRMDFALTKWL